MLRLVLLTAFSLPLLAFPKTGPVYKSKFEYGARVVLQEPAFQTEDGTYRLVAHDEAADRTFGICYVFGYSKTISWDGPYLDGSLPETVIEFDLQGQIKSFRAASGVWVLNSLICQKP